MFNFKLKALQTGVEGEDLAAQYLESQGLSIVERNYHTRYGEIDLIARQGDTWVFVEVKTRAYVSPLSAAEAVTRSKQKKMVGAALSFMKKRRLHEENMRFDVLTLEGETLDWIPNAFESPIPYTF